MAITKTTIIAAFRNSADAQAAAQDLQTAGILPRDIYLETASGATDTYSSRTAKHEGGITGWFKSLFNEDDEHAPYQKALSEGSYLLSVDANEDHVSSIEAILNRHSPVNVHSDDTGTVAAAPATMSGTNATQAIPVVEEELQVGKREVLRGGVRVYSRVVEEPVTESVNLREEHVRVERHPVDRAATASDFAQGHEQVIEIAEHAEEAVVAKQARVVEEIHVGKDVSERTQQIKDSVRHTEVEVEDIPAGQSSSHVDAYDDSAFRSDFETRYSATGATYDTYAPAYRYGYDEATDPRYRGKHFADVESSLRSDYDSRYPGGTWDKMKGAVESGWNKVTGKA